MQITYSAKFEKQYRKLSNEIKNLAQEKIPIFVADRYDSRLKTHKLKGIFDGYFSFSLNNKYRIIFKIVDEENIRFHYVGTHDIYE